MEKQGELGGHCGQSCTQVGVALRARPAGGAHHEHLVRCAQISDERIGIVCRVSPHHGRHAGCALRFGCGGGACNRGLRFAGRSRAEGHVHPCHREPGPGGAGLGEQLTLGTRIVQGRHRTGGNDPRVSHRRTQVGLKEAERAWSIACGKRPLGLLAGRVDGRCNPHAGEASLLQQPGETLDLS